MTPSAGGPACHRDTGSFYEAEDLKSAKVTDVQKAQFILGKYAWYGTALALAENGSLYFAGDFDEYRRLHSSAFEEEVDDGGENDFDLPLAVLADTLPERKDFKDDDEWYAAKWDVFNDFGSSGFQEVLQELSPLLTEQLMVLVLIHEDYRTSVAHVWSVLPGAETVSLEAQSR